MDPLDPKCGSHGSKMWIQCIQNVDPFENVKQPGVVLLSEYSKAQPLYHHNKCLDFVIYVSPNPVRVISTCDRVQISATYKLESFPTVK